jgi:hypothetical protein
MPKFTDAKLSRIVRNACPTGWKKAQFQANLRHLSLAAQTRYYIGLKSVKPNGPASHRNKPNNIEVSNLRKNEKIEPTSPTVLRNTAKYIGSAIIPLHSAG